MGCSPSALGWAGLLKARFPRWSRVCVRTQGSTGGGMGVLRLRSTFCSPVCFQPSFSFLGVQFLQALGTDSAHQS